MSDSGTSLRADGHDPVTASATADAYGRIGLVAWAIFKSPGRGYVITFDKLGRKFSIEVDADSEKQGFMIFAGDMMAAVGRMKP
jgi:hypothetical protein